MKKILVTLMIFFAVASNADGVVGHIKPEPRGLVWNSVSPNLQHHVYAKWERSDDPVLLKIKMFYWENTVNFLTKGKLAEHGLATRLKIVNTSPVLLNTRDGYIYMDGQRVGVSYALRPHGFSRGFEFYSVNIDEVKNTIFISQ